MVTVLANWIYANLPRPQVVDIGPLPVTRALRVAHDAGHSSWHLSTPWDLLELANRAVDYLAHDLLGPSLLLCHATSQAQLRASAPPRAYFWSRSAPWSACRSSALGAPAPRPAGGCILGTDHLRT